MLRKQNILSLLERFAISMDTDMEILDHGHDGLSTLFVMALSTSWSKAGEVVKRNSNAGVKEE